MSTRTRRQKQRTRRGDAYTDRRIRSTTKWRTAAVIAAATVGIGVSGLAVIRESEERVPTTSDLTEQEIIDVANTVREQLEIGSRTLRDERRTVDHALAEAQRAERLEAMRDRYWGALQGRPPGIDEDILSIVERVPRREREVLLDASPSGVAVE